MGTERTHEIDAAASDWLIRRDSGVWSAADQACLEAWLNTSTLNRVAFLRLELAWEDAARLKALGAGVAGDRPPPPGRWNLTPFFNSRRGDADDSEICTEPGSVRATFEESACGSRPVDSPGFAETSALTDSETQLVSEVGDNDATDDSEDMLRSGDAFAHSSSSVRPEERFGFSRRRQVLTVAATVLLAFGFGAYVALAPSGDRYATPVGGFASVPMADGSKVTLNTDSQIRIALTSTERNVDLKRGEAFFEVSKDRTRPFVVRAGAKRVIAVGTKFSVRRDGDDIEVVVTEGKVRVEDGTVAQSSRAEESTDVFLTPGSVARAGEAGVLVQRKTLPEAEEQLSWRTGVLMFRDRSLQEAVNEFNRYNLRKIVIQDPAVGSLKIEGNFRATNAEAFVRLLESGFPVRADSQPDQIVLMSK